MPYKCLGIRKKFVKGFRQWFRLNWVQLFEPINMKAYKGFEIWRGGGGELETTTIQLIFN